MLSDGDDTMSVLLSISSILSLLTFLTTVLALVRVGTAAFASNQPFRQQTGVQPLRLQWASVGESMSLSRTMRLGIKAEREEKERANGAELENGYLGGAPLVRMSSLGMLSSSARPREHSFSHRTVPSFSCRRVAAASPYPRINVPAPISMAKLIISRQNKRKPGRVSVRRPPGLPTSTTPPSRSRLIEQFS